MTETTSSTSPACFRRLLSEFAQLETSLPSDPRCSAWLRFDEDAPQYCRALLTAPLPGPTPYAGAVFCFDVRVPDDYPRSAPKIKLLGDGRTRFGPNLYADGTVCLSLLGTWPGQQWDARRSSLHQLLVSIQSLLLGVEHPYFLEPGRGGWEAKVKEGDFSSEGRTLRGDVVREEMTLPVTAWAYEDRVRLGSVRLGMLGPLGDCLGDAPHTRSTKMEPFHDIIRAHFYYNGTEILETVTGWINASRPQVEGKGGENDPHAIIEPLRTLLYPKLEAYIHKLRPPTLSATNNLSVDKVAATKKNITVPSTLQHASVTTDTIQNTVTANPKRAAVESLQEQMREAARTEDFILAGRLQKQIKDLEEIEDLKVKMGQAASKGDFILAGTLQAKLNSLTLKQPPDLTNNDNDNIDESASSEDDMDNIDDQDDMSVEDDFMDAAAEMEEDDESDNDMTWPNNSPAQHSYSSYGNNHRWGAGHPLNVASSPLEEKQGAFPATKTNVAAAEPIAAVRDMSTSRLSVKEPCRLRIRLPAGSKEMSVLEEFDGHEKLSVVYKCVKSHLVVSTTSATTVPRLVQRRGMSTSDGGQAVGLVGGAFARPHSEYGFTLLLLSGDGRREFGLEMHGATSLRELGLSPSATLTVMSCDGRGRMKRGVLESRLAAARGDAMDVEDLGYEALQELVEKIGVATPGDGARRAVDDAMLHRISTLVSPQDYLSRKKKSVAGSRDDEEEEEEEEEECRCPICLGEFDAEESEPQLRTLNECRHTFHSSCLITCLSMKTSCPICNRSLLD